LTAERHAVDRLLDRTPRPDAVLGVYSDSGHTALAAARDRAVPEVPDCCGLLLERIAGDKEVHARFHRSLLDDALLIDPSRTVSAICAELLMADARPLAEHWRLTGLAGLTGLDTDAVRHLDALDAFLDATRPTALAAGGSL
ncbi:hypothetical protein ACVNF4_34120, partial [Streptomyces sp. S6]